jgi:uncharacterized protein (DUF3820 family)
MPWGKHEGERIADVDSGYLRWLLEKLRTGRYYGEVLELARSIERELYGRGLEVRYGEVKREKRKARRRRPNVEEIEAANQLCARIIIGNGKRYEGLMLDWAHAVLRRPAGTRRKRDVHWQGRIVRVR